MGEPITGVVGILTDETGRPFATVCDFDRSGSGGFTLAEIQTMRVRRSLAMEAMQGMCNGDLASVIDTHRAMELVSALIRKRGWRETIVNVNAHAPAEDAGEGGGGHGAG